MFAIHIGLLQNAWGFVVDGSRMEEDPQSVAVSNASMGTSLFGAPPQCSFFEWSRAPHHAGFLRIFSTISVLTVLVVVVVMGNALVIAAVLLRRRLRSATGLLILSLGVADLLVGTVILPFSIANEVLNGFWIFGPTWCTIWLTMDIWMCTASIYNLVAISIDRYIAIIKPLNYPMLVTKFRARCIVAIVWIGSFLICSPSFILASTEKKSDDCKCTPEHSGRAYIIFSASSSFYLPMIIVIFVYMRIYIAARAATKSIYSGMMSVTANANKTTKSYLMNNPAALNNENLPMLRVHRGSSVAGGKALGDRRASTTKKETPPSYDRSKSQERPAVIDERETSSGSNDNGSPSKKHSSSAHRHQQVLDAVAMQQKNNASSWKLANPISRLIRRAPKKKAGCAYEKRLSLEIKAAKTVAIVTGCFIFCWLGFALLYGLSIKTSDVVWSILFWLGYLNSALNPVIYTVFNREFRICFKRLLTCHHINPQTNTTKNYANNNSYNSTTRMCTKSAMGGLGRPSSSPPHVYTYSTQPALQHQPSQSR